MYRVPSNPCLPVSQLCPEYTALWQCPVHAFLDDEPWFHNVPAGKNPIGMLMRDIPGAAQYTTHSSWATTIITLDDAWFEARHIMRVTQHKSEASIHSYSNRLSTMAEKNYNFQIHWLLKPTVLTWKVFHLYNLKQQLEPIIDELGRLHHLLANLSMSLFQIRTSNKLLNLSLRLMLFPV